MSQLSIATQGPCARKLLATGDQAQDHAQFTMYLEELVNEQVISMTDLDSFFSALDINKLTNPIPSATSNQNWAFHYKEFESLMKSGSIEPSQIQVWARSFISKRKRTENQQEHSKVETKELPVFYAHDGSTFYKIQHPVLGDAYKILKPGGHVNVPTDWEKLIWPVRPLKERITADSEFNKDLPVDDSNPNLISKNLSFRKICRDLGPEIDLPTVDDYYELLKHFQHTGSGVNIIVSQDTIAKYIELFHDSEPTCTSSIVAQADHRQKENTWLWVYAPRFNSFQISNAWSAQSILCVGVLK